MDEPDTFPTTPSDTIRIDNNFDDEMRDLQAGSSSDLVAAKKDLLYSKTREHIVCSRFWTSQYQFGIYSDGSVSWPQTRMGKFTVIPVLVERKNGRPWKTELCDSLRGAFSV